MFKKIIGNGYKFIICFICVILFLAIAEDVFNDDIIKGDSIGYMFVSTYLINDSVTPIMKCITWFGSATCLILITLLSFLFFKDRIISYLLCINLIVITVFNQLFKFMFKRPRPSGFRIIEESGYSFPSGHSMVSMAFYGFLLYLIYKRVSNKYLKWGLIFGIALLIILIGISRIYLGVHYTSDVLGGFLVSIAYLILFVFVIDKLDIFK